MTNPKGTIFAEAVMSLPGWQSVASVSATGRMFQLAAILFFALALIIELVAMFVKNKKHERILQWVGILFFFMCLERKIDVEAIAACSRGLQSRAAVLRILVYV